MERRGPNPLYNTITPITKVNDAITMQTGNQNVIVKDDNVHLTKKLYTQNFTTNYKMDPVLSVSRLSGPKYETTDLSFSKDTNIFTGETSSGPYLNEPRRSSGLTGLSGMQTLLR